MSDEKKTIFGHAAPQNLSIPNTSYPPKSQVEPVGAAPVADSESGPTLFDGGPFHEMETPNHERTGTPPQSASGPEHASGSLPTQQGFASGDAPAPSPYGAPPQGQYGAPPQGQYGAPPQGQYGAPPQGQYGAPPQGQYGAPPQGQYGAPPQGQYGAPPQGQYGAPPQGQYGAPPQGQYGAPPQGQYGAAPGQVPHVQPVKTGLYVGMFFVAFIGFAMIGIGATDPKLTEMIPFAGIPVLVSVIFQWILLYKAWAAIQDGYARTTPGKAVGFLFIPIFSIYWLFIAYGSWGRNFNAFSQRHRVGFEVSEGLFTFHCFMMFFGGPIAIVTGIMVCLNMCRGINAIANRQYGGMPVARVAS